MPCDVCFGCRRPSPDEHQPTRQPSFNNHHSLVHSLVVHVILTTHSGVPGSSNSPGQCCRNYTLHTADGSSPITSYAKEAPVRCCSRTTNACPPHYSQHSLAHQCIALDRIVFYFFVPVFTTTHTLNPGLRPLFNNSS